MIGQLEQMLAMMQEAQRRRLVPADFPALPHQDITRGPAPAAMPFRDPSQLGPAPPTRDQLAAMLPRANGIPAR